MQDRQTAALDVHQTPADSAAPLQEREFPRYADTLGVRPIVKVTAPLMAMIHPHAASGHALRLVLGLLHLTQVSTESIPKGAEQARREAKIERTSLLYRTIGPAAANGAKALHRGVEVLRETNLFDELELPSGASFIRWKFSDAALDAMRDPVASYGLVDIRAVRNLERALPVWLHLDFRQIWNAPYPRVARSVEQLGRVMGIEAPT